MSDFSSTKWITSTGARELQVHSISNVLSRIGKSQCNLISIFGRARQGKSFLMNCLAGEKDTFPISNLKDSCTQGIDISDKWLTLEDFSALGGCPSVPYLGKGKMKVGFVDAEGQGDKDVGYDANLVCPILLTSKCVIFNWKGDLQKDLILQTLGIMTKAAKNIAKDGNLEETCSNGKTFGHLHILFRDWQAVDTDSKSTFDALFQEEGTPEGETRDAIRRAVLDSFSSVEVWLFDPPSESTRVLKEKMNLDMTSEVFREQLGTFRTALAHQLQEPTLFAGQPLTGSNIGQLVHLVTSSLNRGEAVLPSSAFMAMMREEVDCIVRKMDRILHERLKEETDKFNLLAPAFKSRRVIHNEGEEEGDNDSDDERRIKASIGPAESFPTEEKSKDEFHSMMVNLQEIFFVEVQECLGEALSSFMGRNLVKDFEEGARQLLDNIESHYLSKFQEALGRWAVASRRVAEDRLSEAFTHIRQGPTRSDQDLRASLDPLLQEALKRVGADDHPDNIHVSHAIEDIERRFRELSEQTLKENAERYAAEEIEFSNLILTKQQELSLFATSTTASLLASRPRGYPLSVLQEAVEDRFLDYQQEMTKHMKGSVHTLPMLAKFTTETKISISRVLPGLYLDQMKKSIGEEVKKGLAAMDSAADAISLGPPLKGSAAAHSDDQSLESKVDEIRRNELENILLSVSEWEMESEVKGSMIDDPIQNHASFVLSRLQKKQEEMNVSAVGCGCVIA